MTRTLNLLAPKGQFGFGHLVCDALTRRGVAVHWWDYRKERDPFARLKQDAPTLSLRGDAIVNIAQVFDWLSGPKYLWYAEDTAKGEGREIMELASYYQNIWLHWHNDSVISGIKAAYSNKDVSVVPVLYANHEIWKPDQPTTETEWAFHCEVLHFGTLTRRREEILTALRKRTTRDGNDLVIYEIEDSSHIRLAEHVNRAKVILNLHAWSGVNLEIRLAEALSCGAFVVTETLPESAPEFMRSHMLIEVPSGDVSAIFEKCMELTQEKFYDVREKACAQILAYGQNQFSHLGIADDIGPKIWRDWE